MSVFPRVHMPALDGATEWLNPQPLGPAELRGHVGLVNFERRPPCRPPRSSAPRDKLSGLSTNPDATPEHYKLAYDEARRALDAQESVVNELRTRAGILIAAAAITTSFFGGRALSDGDVATAGWIAIACFGVVGASVLAVLWPRTDWTFTVNAHASSGRTSRATTVHCHFLRSIAIWRCT